MLLFSQIIGRSVTDAKGTALGRLKDLIASGGSYPTITALVVEGGNHQRFTVAWEQVSGVSTNKITLNVTKRHIVLYEVDDAEISLSEQVMDRQLLDVDGHRIGRVNDIQLGKTNSHYRVLAIDPSTRGLLRRLGIEKAVTFVGIRPEDQLIPWSNLQLTGGANSELQVKVPGHAISKIHPSDLADLLEQLSIRESSSLIEAMDDEEAADTLEEISARRQVQILRDMDSARAADILEEMAPNDAADVLADMPASKAAELLALMEKKESLEVRELLAYPEDSAGGIMTTEYVSMPETLTVRDAMRRLRKTAKSVEHVYYVYVVNNPEEEQLIGTISLRELLSSSSDRTLAEIADRSAPTVQLSDSQETVAQVIAKYDLLAVPVLDDQERLQGIVTVDEAMDVLLPAAWRKRLPRMFTRVSPNGASPKTKAPAR